MTIKRCAIIVAALAMAAQPAGGQGAPDQAARIAALSRETDAVVGYDAVKTLQIAYGQFAENGQWRDMADLFADDAVATFGALTVHGRAEIGAYLLQQVGGGREGLPPGGVRYQIALTPVISLSGDGRSAKGRWHELAMLGSVGGEASWAGGIYENEYRNEGGVWKIARLHYYPQFAGPYAEGWRNVESDLKVVPYHYTPESAGVPIPRIVGQTVASPGPAAASLQRDEARLARLLGEAAVRNLQNAYGYYVDRRMWDDVTDLFDAGGTLTVHGLGTWVGPKDIRHGLERDGPAGLVAGELNEHVQASMIVTLSPDGQQARARGLELGLTGTNRGKGFWSVTVFENRYAKRDGVWRITAMQLFPRLRSDYALGWAKSAIVDAPRQGQAPNRPGVTPRPLASFPYLHPVTGRTIGAASRATASAALPKDRTVSEARITAAEAQLQRARAFAGAENVSNAFGNYIDDFEWNKLSRLFARKGAREMPYVGFYIGPERIEKAEVTKWGQRRSPRTSIPIHLRIQPVIDVAADGRSARLRTRLFSMGSSFDRAGTFSGGMYPNDQAVLEDGVWKLWSVAIDEFYYRSATYAEGWTNVEAEPAQKTPDMLLRAFPPDIPLTALGQREQGFIPGSTVFNPYVFNGPAYPGYPSATPMWFSYPNPVSGRMPQYYWPDCVTCVARPETGLQSNGY